MSFNELKTILDELNVPVAYNHFNTKTTIPYLVFYEDGSNNFYADNKVYGRIKNITIELYTNKKMLDLEGRLETILNDAELPFEVVSESFLNDENLYMRVYSIEI